MRHHLRVRRFLNRAGHHGGAYIIAVVPDSLSCNDKSCGHYFCGEPELAISDCDRVIRLELSRLTAADRRNSLHKVDVLLDTLTRFRAALELEVNKAGPGRPPAR